MTAPSERRFRLRRDALDWKILEDETVVLDLRRSNYLAINRTGTLLWPLLVEGATRAELIEKLRSAWNVEEAAAARDVDRFCTRLEAEGLLGV